MKIQIIIPIGIYTLKSVAWGGKAKDLFHASQEAIRYEVQNHPHCQLFQEWLESRKKLQLTVDFYLNKQRASRTDLDSLLSDLFNPLVEGACGPRAAGKPIPQTKDALFWRVIAAKIEHEEEKTVVQVELITQ